MSQNAFRFAGNGNPGGRAEPDIAQRLILFTRGKPGPELNDADVARVADHVRQRQGLRTMEIGYRSDGRLHLAAERVDDLVRACALPLEKCGGDEWLECRAGLEWLCHCGVGEDFLAIPAARHGENLTAVRIHDDDVAATRFKAVGRPRECALADLLKVTVDREGDVAPPPRLRRPSPGRVEPATAYIARDAGGDRIAAENAVQHELESADRLSVVTDGADDSSDSRRACILPLHHRFRVHALHGHQKRHLRGNVQPRKRNPFFLSVDRSTGPREGKARFAHQSRQQSRVFDLVGSNVQPYELTTLDENVAGRVEDISARRDDGACAELLPPGTLCPILPLNDLHLRRLPDQRDGKEHQHEMDYADAAKAYHRSSVALR